MARSTRTSAGAGSGRPLIEDSMRGSVSSQAIGSRRRQREAADLRLVVERAPAGRHRAARGQWASSRLRYFFEMVRPNLDDIPERTLPDGLEIRPIDVVARDARCGMPTSRHSRITGAASTAPRSTSSAGSSNPNTDLSLWVVAFDGDEVAGGVLNGIDREQNEQLGIQRGWLNSVFTRREWRRRGLARRLIVESFRRPSRSRA